MARIEDRDKALSLARAIMADVTLYNSRKLKDAANPVETVASEIEEARDLFDSRVVESLAGCFDEEVVRWAAQRGATYVPPARPAHRPPPTPAVEQRAREQELRLVAIERIKRQRVVMIAVMVLVAAAFIAFFALERRHEHEEQHDKHEGAH